MRRFFTEPQNIAGNTAYIFEDARHIEKALRMSVGDELIVFDGSGFEYTARLTEISKNRCTAEITEKRESLSEPKVKITLFQALPKAGKMETVIQKAVELGVYEIVPVITERCVTKIANAAAAAEKAARWNKVSVEAAKQCGRGIIPKVCLPLRFEDAIGMMQKAEVAILPYEELGHGGEKGLRGALAAVPNAASYSVMVGPEGGFSDREAEYARENGISLVGLGKRILRTETVASAIIPVIMFFRDEF